MEKEMLRHYTVFMGVQQFATLAVHKRFFVGDHFLPVTIRFEECGFPRDVVDPNLRDIVKVGGWCPWSSIVGSVSSNVPPIVVLPLPRGGDWCTMNFTP